MMMTASLSAPAAARRSLVACESVELECDTLSAPPPMASAPLPTPAPKSSGGVFNKLLRRFRSAGDTAEQVPAPTRGPNAVRIVVAAGQHAAGNGAIVFDSTNESLPDEVWFTSFMVRFADPQLTADAIDPGLVLLLYVGDPATPRARIRLADVLRLGGRRPLNLRREPGQIVRLVLDDPAGTWANGVPALEIVLDMK